MSARRIVRASFLEVEEGTDRETASGQTALSEREALALAQFLKRLRFHQAREIAVDQDEAYTMIDATNKLARALADAGYDPR